jgi:translation initiation factor 2B subunit (eIF-2B alpha/beta/delta family)
LFLVEFGDELTYFLLKDCDGVVLAADVTLEQSEVVSQSGSWVIAVSCG